MLGYQVKIWDHFLRQSPQADTLPVIIPVVLAQNRRKWAVSPRFRSLLGLPTSKESVWAQFVPDLTFRLIELAGLRFEEIAGTPLGIVTLRLLKAERPGDHLIREAVIQRLQFLLGQNEGTAVAGLSRHPEHAPTVNMSTTTKAKKSVSPSAAKRRHFRPDLPPISPESPMYGHDDLIGCVSIKVPSAAAARRALIRARIHADNHS